MAKLSKDEVAEKCGMPRKSLMVYIGRGKLTVLDSGDIDDQDQKNKAFIHKYSRKAAMKGILPQTEDEELISESLRSGQKKEPSDNNLIGMEAEKLALQNKKLQAEIERLTLANKKTTGNNLPTEHIQPVIIHLSEQIYLQCEGAIDTLITEICGRHQIARSEMVSLRQLKVDIINKAKIRGVEEAKKQIRRISREVSDKRGVGEHG